ncbi:MAG: hypothetical protein IKY15_00470 [Clostridia bacterium]|nr:hypothetical protein [Clostridia bacterium]
MFFFIKPLKKVFGCAIIGFKSFWAKDFCPLFLGFKEAQICPKGGKTMRKYELLYAISATVNEQERENIIAK